MTCIKQKRCFNAPYIRSQFFAMHFTPPTFQSDYIRAIANAFTWALTVSHIYHVDATDDDAYASAAKIGFGSHAFRENGRTICRTQLDGQALGRSYLRQLAVKSVRVFCRIIGRPTHAPESSDCALSRDKMHPGTGRNSWPKNWSNALPPR